MCSKATSFQKKGRSKVPNIQGTRPSLQNAQLLVSSGVPSFDYVIGGGIPVGTIVLIEEDTYGTFAKLLIKYFLAEGVMSGHDLLCASQDYPPEHLVQELPASINLEPPPGSNVDTVEDRMTIAWRYQNLRTVQSSPSGIHFGHHYDLTKSMDPEMLKSVHKICWSNSSTEHSTSGNFSNPAYQCLLTTIQARIDEGQLGVTASPEPEQRNILRVAVHSLGSPLWGSNSGTDLPLFLYILRALLRQAYAICLLSVPSHLFHESSLIKQCHHLSDTAVRLESFAGSDKETNPAFRDYHGLFHINKLSAINTLASHIPESLDLAFKLRRKKFVIEKLHLPPELQETTQREQDDGSQATMGCGGRGRSLLDF